MDDVRDMSTGRVLWMMSETVSPCLTAAVALIRSLLQGPLSDTFPDPPIHLYTIYAKACIPCPGYR